MKDLYQTLGITKEASPQEVKKAVCVRGITGCVI